VFEAIVLNEEWADGSPILKLTRKPPAEIVERLSVMYRFSWVRPKARVETEEIDELSTPWIQLLCGCNTLVFEGFDSEVFNFTTRAAVEAKQQARIIRLHTTQKTSQAASNRHTATNLAKEFVRAEWSRHRSAYKNNKSEFARTYVALIANQFQDAKGDPLKVTEKTIKDKWLKSTLPAGIAVALLACG
jgi:hypothetical protein